MQRYQCPKCGGGLTYTASPWPIYVLRFTDIGLPVLKIYGLIILTGAILSLIHPILALVGILTIVAAIWFLYFSPLQCDDCESWFISGQFRQGRGGRLPWTQKDSYELAKRYLIVCLIFTGIFSLFEIPVYLYQEKCISNCKLQNRQMKETKRPFDCECVSIPTNNSNNTSQNGSGK